MSARALLLGLLLTAAARPGPGAGAEPARVHVAVHGLSSDIVFYLGLEKGYFAAEGLAVQLVPTKGGLGVEIQALVNGTVDVSAGTFSPGLAGAMREAGMRIVAANSLLVKGRPASAYCLVRKDLGGRLRSFADLKGRVLLTPTAGSLSHIWLLRRLEGAGLREDEVAFKFLPNSMLPSLLINKEVDVAMLSEPLASRIVETGLAQVFAETGVAQETAPMTLLYYSRRFLARPGAAARFMAAYLRSARAFSRTAPRDLEPFAVKVWGAPVAAGVLARLRFSEDGRIDPRALMDAQDYALRKGWIQAVTQAEVLIDPSFVRRAEADRR